MQKISMLVLALALCVSLASAQTTWSQSCTGSGNATLTVSSVTLSPDPPVKGTDDVVTLTGTLGEAITAGNIQLAITYFGFPVFNQNYPVGPFAVGAITSSITVSGSSLPSFAPSGSGYEGVATFTDDAGATIACVTVDFSLSG